MLLTQSILSYIKMSDKEQEVLDSVRTLHYKLCTYFSVQKSATASIEKLKNYIEKLVQLGIVLDEELIFDSVIYAYQQRNKKYPADFTMRLALEYMQNRHSNSSKSLNIEEHSGKLNIKTNMQKIEDIEKHIERISLIKLQLTKNIKELESQGKGHLWLDHEFVDPALDTLKGSFAQVQEIENRILVLKVTYQDYQG